MGITTKEQAQFVADAVVKDITASQSSDDVYRKLVYGMGDFVGCLNEMCESEMIDALALLKKTKFFKREIKMYANDAMRTLSLYVQRARASVKEKDVYLSYVDSFYEHYKPDVTQLYWSLRQEFTKNGLGGADGDLISHIILVHNLLSTSTGCFDDLINDGYKHCHINFRECFASRYYINVVFYKWKVMVHAVLDKLNAPNDININNSKECNLAYKIFYEKLRRGKYLDEAAVESMAENYDSLDDEMREAYDNLIKTKLKDLEQ